MKPFVLSPLHQVEYAIPDLKKSQRFFTEVFGECEVEAVFSAVLTNPALAIRHAGFGGTVQQFCEPLMEGLPHYDAVQAYGPCVHNLCYLVDDIDAIVANCRDAGFDQLIDFPLTDIWRSVIDEGNLTGNHHSYIMATRDLFGFQLELAETPWITQPQPPLMLPAHGPQWSEVGVASGNKLLGINVVVHDLEATQRALQAVFGENLRVLSSPEMDESSNTKTLLVELGEVPLAYSQPLGSGTELARFMAERGPAVHSLVTQVDGLKEIRTRLGGWDLETSPIDFELEPALRALVQGSATTAAAPDFQQVAALQQLGVNFILCERRA